MGNEEESVRLWVVGSVSLDGSDKSKNKYEYNNVVICHLIGSHRR
jgi:hypothetical protein